MFVCDVWSIEFWSRSEVGWVGWAVAAGVGKELESKVWSMGGMDAGLVLVLSIKPVDKGEESTQGWGEMSKGSS